MINDAYGKKHTLTIPDDLKGSIAQKKKRFKYELMFTLFFYVFGILCGIWGWFLAKH